MSTTGNEVETNYQLPQNMGQDIAPSESLCREVGNPHRVAFDVHKVEDHGEVGGKCKRRELRNSRSSLWVHSDKHDSQDENTLKVRCKYCRAESVVGSVTNDVIYHCGICKRKPHDVTTSQMRCNMRKSVQGTIDDVRACRELCTTVISDELMFKFVERAGVRHFLSVVRPELSIPSGKSLAKGILQIYIEEKLKLKSLLKESAQRVCISIDTWTSVQEMNYVRLTVHFIDNDWQLHKKILNFRPITGRTGEEIGEVVTKCISEWGVENIFTITVDDFYSSDNVVSLLKKMMDAWETSILSNQYVHVRCISSLINQSVHHVLKDDSEAVDCIRGAIRYVQSTPVRYEAISEFAELECEETNKLMCLDIPNRWDSTYLMLDSATSFQNAFCCFKKTDGNFSKYVDNLTLGNEGLSYEHWKSAKYLVTFLGHLYDINQKISGSSNGTSNSVFHDVSVVDLLLRDLCKADDWSLRLMAKYMKGVFDKNMGSVEKRNKILYYAVIFDPRYKLEFLEYCFDKIYDAETSEKIKREVKESMASLFDEYKRIYDDVECCSSFVSTTPPSSSRAAELSNHEFVESRKPSLVQEFKKIKCGVIGTNVKSELDRYLAEKVEIASEENDKFNILLWWKINVRRFPILSKIARDVLAVPFCTVTSDAAFNTGVREYSTGVHVLDAFKSSLLPKTVEALVCVEDWFRDFVMPVSVEEDIHEAHWLEKELSKLSVASSLSSFFD